MYAPLNYTGYGKGIKKCSERNGYTSEHSRPFGGYPPFYHHEKEAGNGFPLQGR